MEYIAAIFSESGQGFGVVFPDLPGCVSHGETLENARESAREALELHLEGMAEDGETIPRPMSLDKAKESDLCEGAEAFIFVPAPVSSKTVRINVTLPADDLERIDSYAKAHGYTRSGLLLRGARDVLARG